MTKDDYRQMLDYYREPCVSSTASASSYEPPRSVSDLTPLQTGDVQQISSMLSESELAREEQSEGFEHESVTRNITSNGHDNPASRDPKAPPDEAFCVEKTDSCAAAGSSQFELPDPRINPLAADLRKVVERLQTYLEDETCTHEQLIKTYSQLPSVGVKYLSDHYRRLLLHRLSVIERKSKTAMLRYLTLVDHMREASIPLLQAEWNSAIAYAGRCYMRVEAAQVEGALRIWKEMEREAGVKSGTVTFNILFDIAIKAGKYVLAEMILEEMKTRGLEYNRFSYVSLIYYYGVKGDGGAVRKTYRDMVDAGQIIDTVVMNCVIASLIRAKELPAAEQIFERMKKLVYQKTGQFVPNSDWRATRDLGRALDIASRTMRDDKEGLQRLQAEQFLVPDLRTFYIFIDHHTLITGELRRVTALLEDMQTLRIPMHGRIYLKIFRGFAYHGGVKYTSWTRQRLETVWTSLLSVLDGDSEVEHIYMMKWMVIWVVRAFAQCCGRTRALQIWEVVRDRWRIAGEDEKGTVEHHLRHVLEDEMNGDRH
ncbi:MAG: hypothetical protein Q9207_005891 [Kuettlingeria erythrocarpa]